LRHARRYLPSFFRRLQRFFAGVRFDYDAIACFIVRFMGIESGPWMLALDRTNWKFGKKHINILMLAICHKGVAVLDCPGKSGELLID
jgi:hypothetical protein